MRNRPVENTSAAGRRGGRAPPLRARDHRGRRARFRRKTARRGGTSGARAPSRGRAVSVAASRVDAKLAAVVEIIDKIGIDLAELAVQIAETDSALALLRRPDCLPCGAPHLRDPRPARRGVVMPTRAPRSIGWSARPISVGAGCRRLPRRRNPAQAARRCRVTAGDPGRAAGRGGGGSRGFGRPSESDRLGTRGARRAAPPRPRRSGTRRKRR